MNDEGFSCCTLYNLQHRRAVGIKAVYMGQGMDRRMDENIIVIVSREKLPIKMILHYNDESNPYCVEL